MSHPKFETQDLREAFGDTIRAWREGRGLNRTEFAERVGFTRQRLFQLEAGMHSPTYDMLLRLAEQLDTTAWNLGRCLEERLHGRVARKPREHRSSVPRDRGVAR